MEYEKNLEYYFTHLWRNYVHDEILSDGTDLQEREKFLGDYEVILAKMEHILGEDRLRKMQKDYPKLLEKYDLAYDFKDVDYYIKPKEVFEKISEELKKEERKFINLKKKNFVEDFGRLMKKYEIMDVKSMNFDEKKELISVHYENGAGKKINVACDSEWGMIIDIGKQLEKNPYVVSFAADEKYEVHEEEQEYDV